MNDLDLHSVFSDEQAKGNLLTAVRKEMYDSLRLFQDHVKHLLSLMFTVFTALVAILGFTIKGDGQTVFDPKIVALVGGVVLLLMFFLGNVSTIIISRYYRLYVSALIYAADLHDSVDLGAHPWFRDLTNARSEAELPGQFLQQRAFGWPHSWFLYAMLIWALSYASLVAGLSPTCWVTRS